MQKEELVTDQLRSKLLHLSEPLELFMLSTPTVAHRDNRQAERTLGQAIPAEHWYKLPFIQNYTVAIVVVEGVEAVVAAVKVVEVEVAVIRFH